MKHLKCATLLAAICGIAIFLGTGCGIAQTEPAKDETKQPEVTQSEPSKDEAAQPSEMQGRITYKLSADSDKWDPKIKKRITDAMDAAIATYNQEGNFKKALTVGYSPHVKTADGSNNGHINFGHSISRQVALHEIAHTLGIGTHWNWRKFIKDGKWTGEHALAQLREFNGPNAVLHADRMHFWPYGLNYAKESNPESDRRHVKMVAALRLDMGIANGK